MDYNKIINQLKKKYNFISNEIFNVAQSGTIHKVFLSRKFVIRFRQNDKIILKREKELLKKLNHPLVPKILATGEVDSLYYVIENCLPGKNINVVWKNILPKNQKLIIESLIDFLRWMQTEKGNNIYSIRYGKNYNSFYEYLIEDLNEKILALGKFPQVQKSLNQLTEILFNSQSKKLFADSQVSLVHGDLIFHNLLTDGKNLTGVLDWERSLMGDPDYDIFRLMNFKLSAKAYMDVGKDENNETGYLKMLLFDIESSELIKNKKTFRKKYEIARASYYLNALYWDIKSENPYANVQNTLKEIQNYIK